MLAMLNILYALVLTDCDIWLILIVCDIIKFLYITQLRVDSNERGSNKNNAAG